MSEIDEEKDFRISDTLHYLKNREGKGDKRKEVDRKASKNRKIRYDVHAKLLNFIPSRPLNLLQTRDEIVDNIFNFKSAGEGRKETGEETFYIDM